MFFSAITVTYILWLLNYTMGNLYFVDQVKTQNSEILLLSLSYSQGISHDYSNWHPISCRFGVIAAYCSNFGHFAFLATLWGLRNNVRCSAWADLKAGSGLPISVNWTSLLGVTVEPLQAITGSKSTISLQRGPVDPKFQIEVVAPTNHFSSQKTRLNGLSCGIKIWTQMSFFSSQFTRLTDGQTDGQTDRSLDRVCIICSAVKTELNSVNLMRDNER